MNLLMVGNGAGSWAIRGQQLGAALGARVTTEPSTDDWRWADLAVLVKNAGARFALAAHAAKVPIVWDALDCWSQPAENGLLPGDAVGMLKAKIAGIRPALTICATRAMADACGGTYLPHHSWAGLTPTPPRAPVATVGYQGNTGYLGRWLEWILEACRRRGWTFAVNPSDLGAMDLLVAFRDGPWDGWMCREWKSGVKAVNAIAAGRPFISQDSAAVRELLPTGSVVESAADLDVAFDLWAPRPRREMAFVAAQRAAPAFTVTAIATLYRTVLQTVGVSCVG